MEQITPQEKAILLVGRFKTEQPLYEDDTPEENEKHAMYFAKRCAIIAVDELIKIAVDYAETPIEEKRFWKKVKKAIIKIKS